jgi:hypothetical protein
MSNKILARCAHFNFRHIVVWSVLLAIVLEGITIGLRFGLNVQSTRDTLPLGVWTFGLRVHHGYIGLFLLPLAWCFPRGLRHALWIIALGLILSDLSHHFLVLWPITGSPECDLVYTTLPY